MEPTAGRLALQISLNTVDVAALRRAECKAQRERYEAHKRMDRAETALKKANMAFVRTCRRNAPTADQKSAKIASQRAYRAYINAESSLKLSRDNIKTIQVQLSLARQCHDISLPLSNIFKPSAGSRLELGRSMDNANERRLDERLRVVSPEPQALLIQPSNSPVAQQMVIDLTNDLDDDTEFTPDQLRVQARSPPRQPQMVIDLTSDVDGAEQVYSILVSQEDSTTAPAAKVPIQSSASVLTPLNSPSCSRSHHDATASQQQPPIAYTTSQLLSPKPNRSAMRSDRLDFGEDRSAARAIIAAGLAGDLRRPVPFAFQPLAAPDTRRLAGGKHAILSRSRAAVELEHLLRDERHRRNARQVRIKSPAVRSYEAVRAAKAKRALEERKRARHQHEQRIAKSLRCCDHCTLG